MRTGNSYARLLNQNIECTSKYYNRPKTLIIEMLMMQRDLRRTIVEILISNRCWQSIELGSDEQYWLLRRLRIVEQVF